KLLRVLQEGEFERIGDSRTRKVNVRLVAATNVDLQQAVDAGKFRADLYYRLNIFPILIPALRERDGDIPALVNRFLEKYTALHGKRTPGITERALSALRNYNWPGNIRELENIIERGVIITANDTHIDLPNLFPELSVEAPVTTQTQTSTLVETPTPQTNDHSLDRMLDQILDQKIPLGTVENRLLDRAVERARGNLASAGRMLGLSRPQMAYRLKKYSTP
ncbi:MAG: sigma 54-interacting transcriptional regulator, partial [Candidatus Thiodiazotropha endolucinida]|nr:sigma 54-interacting transcriptional regulator [Candidatus Thiodiazotropha taylori]MCW4249217.1 sigma 54-interacting transcriptional regulator [Candidatus Thiodiazotropha endolucinida]